MAVSHVGRCSFDSGHFLRGSHLCAKTAMLLQLRNTAFTTWKILCLVYLFAYFLVALLGAASSETQALAVQPSLPPTRVS